MEAHRPDPVNLHRFSVGEGRFDVVSQIGAPLAAEADGGERCDMYNLVTHGVRRAGKAAIILGEAAADVSTLGLAEVIATPVEGATRSALHTVAFCYSPNATLDFITESRTGGVVVVLGEPVHRGSSFAAETPKPTLATPMAGSLTVASSTARQLAPAAKPAAPRAPSPLTAAAEQPAEQQWCPAPQPNGVVNVVPC
jgi:hypothetical protein